MAIAKVRAGQRVRIRPLNDLIDVINTQFTVSGPGVPRLPQSGLIANGVNKSDVDFRLGDIAAIDLDAPLIDPDNPTNLAALGTTVKLRKPTPTDFGNWVVCGQAIPIDQSGGIFISGIVLARIKDEGSQTLIAADIDAEEESPTLLKALPEGGAMILGTFGETPDPGELWALIRFPRWSAIPNLYEATSNEAYGLITGKRVNSDGTLAGDDETFIVIGSGS